MGQVKIALSDLSITQRERHAPPRSTPHAPHREISDASARMTSEKLSPGPRSALSRSTTPGSNRIRRSPFSLVAFSKPTDGSGMVATMASTAKSERLKNREIP
jgi:hypothetical protein